jgi:hypothetical protein
MEQIQYEALMLEAHSELVLEHLLEVLLQEPHLEL